MGDKTGIEWTDATWNPIRGCSRVSAGCVHCYAETVAKRFSGAGQPYEGLIHPTTGGWNGVVRAIPSMLDQPMRWKEPRMIFVNSMSDLFHENLPIEEIDRVFAVMMCARRHTFQVLTKRPERMRAYLTDPETRDRVCMMAGQLAGEAGKRGDGNMQKLLYVAGKEAINGDSPWWPLPNVWLGTSVENQGTANTRIPHLLMTPAAVRWISAEPLLGPVDLTRIMRESKGDYSARAELSGPPERESWTYCDNALTGFRATKVGGYIDNKLDWVVVGGESGPESRPMHVNWARQLREQCAIAAVPFLFKQWGDWAPATSGMYFDPMIDNPKFLSRAGGRDTHDFGDGLGAVRVGKKSLGRELDGVIHDGYPR